MSGNYYQYDPAQMFKDWIQKSGKAQAEFMKNFGALMNQSSSTFDPLETLKTVTDKVADAQSNIVENFSQLQAAGMNKMFNLAQMMPNFLSWGTYKTVVGSTGRISIPEAERDALGLKEGDLVQVFVLPIEKKAKRR